ncbi:MAG: DnaD domain protein [Desulfosporosinus sp.]|nr:DnaD domain protein [Desulfosporosinus sp.]
MGHLHFLWWWCLEYANDGDLSKFDALDIAVAAGWEGDAGDFVTALVECGPGDSMGFIEQTDLGLAIHDWMDYAGRLIEKRQANTKRMQNARAKNKHVRNTGATRATNVQGLPYPTVPNPTEPYLTVPNHNIIDDVIPCEGELDSEKTSETMTEPEPVDLKLVVKKFPCNLRSIGTLAVEWAEKNWGRMIPKGDADSILAWCDEFSTNGSEDPDAVVIEGLKYCLDADARNVNYLRAVLTDWREAGILSVDQVKAREAEHIKQKKCKRNKDPGDKLQSAKKESSKYEKFYL